jgi:serine/threonine protein kinase
MAPEVLQMMNCKFPRKFYAYSSADVFVLGCIFYYVLNDREHLFGENLGRDKKILDGKRDFTKTKIKDQLMIHLIKDMTEKKPSNRPCSRNVLYHPSFWTIEETLDFFKKANLTTLQKHVKEFELFIPNWVTLIHQDIIKELEMFNQTKAIHPYKLNPSDLGSLVRTICYVVRKKRKQFKSILILNDFYYRTITLTRSHSSKPKPFVPKTMYTMWNTG